MNLPDYIYFSLLKRSIKNWKVSKYDTVDAKASFINGLLYVLFIYNVAKIFGFEFHPDPNSKVLAGYIVTCTIGMLPLAIYSFGGRARLIHKYRDQVSNGGWIMVVLYVLCFTTVFIWNSEFIFGE